MSKIVSIPGLESPAMIFHHDCETVYVNAEDWKTLTTPERKFVAYHEQAHCHYNIQSEEKADKVAVERMMNEGYSPVHAQTALKKLVPNQVERMDPLTLMQMQSYTAQQGAGAYGGAGGANWIESILTPILGAAPGVIGAFTGNQPQPVVQAPPPQPRDNTPLYIGGGLVFLLLVVMLMKS